MEKLKLLHSLTNSMPDSKSELIVLDTQDFIIEQNKTDTSLFVDQAKNNIQRKKEQEERKKEEEAHKIFLNIYIDNSGSMAGSVDDVNRGISEFVTELRRKNIYLTLIFFNSSRKIIYREKLIKDITGVSFNYSARGSTAFYDSVFESISEFEERHSKDNASSVFVIATDGIDNDSRKYDKKALKDYILFEQERGRQFYFLGNSLDLVNLGMDIGIKEENIALLTKENHGMRIALNAITEIVKNHDSNKSDWKKEIESHRERTLRLENKY